MSLTSYRAAPPRDSASMRRIFLSIREDLVFIRFGGDLLSHALRRSTIGASVLNFRVRDGIGCFTRAMTTKPNKYQGAILLALISTVVQVFSLRCVCF